jgi:tetratricopeptide (TPR) repeat protein
VNYLKLIDASEELLRSGQVFKATQNFKKITLSKVSANDSVSVARLARRTGQVSAGIKVLQRQISKKQTLDRHPLEFQAEYAVLLTLMGCVPEALDILKDVTTQSMPEALLAKAWCYFEVWEYSKAIPLLKKYVRTQDDEYLRLAGQVNLAEALLGAGDTDSAIAIATKSANEAKRRSYNRLLVNALHIRAQAYELIYDLANSNRDLKAAIEISESWKTSDAFLVRRQIAINDSIRNKKNTAILKAKAEALALSEFESTRQFDYKILDIKFTNELFNHLYYGSPYEQFRSQLLKRFPQGKVLKSYLWGDKAGAVLDLSNAKVRFKGKEILITPQVHRLLLTLIKDFYNPVRVGGIFSLCFPGAHFFANHSPTVVHQALKRLRQWFEENEIPLTVECTKRRYRLIQLKPVAIALSKDSFKELEGISTLKKLQRAFGIEREFGMQEAIDVLGLSKASTHRALAAELTSGSIEKKYQGRNTKYLIRKDPKS